MPYDFYRILVNVPMTKYHRAFAAGETETSKPPVDEFCVNRQPEYRLRQKPMVGEHKTGAVGIGGLYLLHNLSHVLFEERWCIKLFSDQLESGGIEGRA